MSIEKDLKKKFKSEKTRKHQEQKIEQTVKKEATLLAEKIDKMSPQQYSKFIDEAIERLTLRTARKVDTNNKLVGIKASISNKAMTEKQMSTLILSHCITLGIIGTFLGATVDHPIPLPHSMVLGGTAGMGSGLVTSFLHFILADENTLINFLKTSKIKMLERKAKKLNVKIEHEVAVLNTIRQSHFPPNNICHAASKILMNLAKNEKDFITSNITTTQEEQDER